ncbi:cytochrome b6-f complex iron-sulfur subunit 1 [Acidithrix ferrooxidans]|uniref:Cytochrome b6-f complex iron-sulfur subunit 1 n=2 Tax=Acidithrix ferrooxidans TaxID=1280514 RepID=A0A0D8HIZ3_9ACTN|nr:cytochrome b6-f complex iron-sulfur subunit 1 [Acidithrix ferrooxidans]
MTPGWILLPLRIFLGITFTFAGGQKLANPAFFNSANPASIQAQLNAYALRSPLHLLLQIAMKAPVVFGVLIAVGEIAVGVGILLGVFTKVAAFGGLTMSFILFLSVSFHSNPYYTGSDIVFCFAWTAFLFVGDGGVMSLANVISRRRHPLLAEPSALIAGIEFSRIMRVCGNFDDGKCAKLDGLKCNQRLCPVLNEFFVSGGGQEDPKTSHRPYYDSTRRRFIVTAGAAGGAAALLGGASAGFGRALGSSKSSFGVAASNSTNSTSPASTTTSTTTPSSTTTTSVSTANAAKTKKTVAASGPVPKGTPVGPATGVPVGKVASFVDPALGQPAYVLHPKTNEFVAFSAVCPHAGCTVQYAGSDLFQCPCHGSQFNALTGAVLQGPAPRGLTPIKVVEGPNGQLYVDG